MMSLPAKLAYSQLKNNRRRTMWTLVGIILSTALITTVCTLVASGTNAVLLLGGDPAQHGVLFVIFAIPAAIVIAIIVAMSVIVISNSFNISAAQRTAQFGILKSTGATAQQIKATVMYESIFLSLVGIPIGLIVGLALAYAGVRIANTQLAILDEFVHMMVNTISVQLVYTVSWQALHIAAAMSFATVLLSARKPAKKAAKIPAIEAIRGVGEVKIDAKQVRTSPITQKLFGFEGVLAAKSIKRSKRNFRASVISLTMAVIMFVVASGISNATDQIEKMMMSLIDAPVIVEYSSLRVWQHDPYTDEWQSYFPAPIHSDLAFQILDRLREFPDTDVWGNGGAWENYRATLPREFLTEKMRGLAGDATIAATGVVIVDPTTHARLAD
ncbi:MAG: FtsX-like permease family protein, partial [Defluviitaleaceae bacterium]|nr:FtsX-like permease family protein [Defluviitaleaceae bacterium]